MILLKSTTELDAMHPGDALRQSPGNRKLKEL